MRDADETVTPSVMVGLRDPNISEKRAPLAPSAVPTVNDFGLL